MIIFETGRLIVRRFTNDDEDDFFSVNGDEEVVRYIRPAKTREESAAFLQEVIRYTEAYPLFGRWAVQEKESGKFVGLFALIPVKDTDKMQLGYSLLRESRGKGYATELTNAGIRYFFQKTGFPVIYAQTEPENSPSIKVLLRSGFAESGRHQEGEKEIIEFSFTIV